MLLGILCLVLGILGLVKKKVSVTNTRELRGTPMYVVSILLISAMPLGFVLSFIVALINHGSDEKSANRQVLIAELIGFALPILMVFIIGFTMGKPKIKETPPEFVPPIAPPPPPPARSKLR